MSSCLASALVSSSLIINIHLLTSNAPFGRAPGLPSNGRKRCKIKCKLQTRMPRKKSYKLVDLLLRTS
ncbi:hypothetical protein EYC80_000531 [Monilinia laxa]|uniref:Uncharacterized protein n=1 Tax=Monilinia laxa TaxID=61186 RepID=A0A5N6KAZ4_MONLA|nr:hypothetical protein EYC80_000531 [Monilinia laxa]